MEGRKPARALVALSGGVDSSVAAALLKDQGWEIAAVTLKTFCYADLPGGPKSCCGLEGVEMARAVAGRLGIPHFVLDVSDRFKTAVIDDFVKEYVAGRTPNPCVLCNATVKIPELLEKARGMGFSALATGHYARILPAGNGWGLFRGLDPAKDQSYFLWKIPHAILGSLLFPIGELTKPVVRALAERFGLVTARKPESQEICFVAEGDYVQFLRRILPADHPGFRSGRVVDPNGKTLGRHKGYLGFTIGQRRGLGGGHGRRLFVIGIRPDTLEVIAGEETDLMRSRISMDQVNVLTSQPLTEGSPGILGTEIHSVPQIRPLEKSLGIQIRHRAKPLPARILTAPPAGPWEIVLETPAKAITPGQSAVLYLDDQLLAGGRILSAFIGG